MFGVRLSLDTSGMSRGTSCMSRDTFFILTQGNLSSSDWLMVTG